MMAIGTIITSIASAVVMIIYAVSSFRLAKAFGKSALFGLGLIVLEPLFMLFLAFSKADYVGDYD